MFFHIVFTPDQANILVEETGRIRIADFGLTKITKNPYSVKSGSYQNGFTMRWVAPEVWSKGEYSEEADIFSFAMVTIEVRSGDILARTTRVYSCSFNTGVHRCSPVQRGSTLDGYV